MTLYTEPPTGNISCQKLEKFALKRLDFLLKVRAAKGDLTKLHQLVCEPADVVDSDCLIAGSLKDKISHFILRLLMGGDPETQQFFEESETAWFDFQFSCMSEDEMKKFFQSIDKILQKDNHSYSYKNKKEVSREGELISHILSVFRMIRQSVGCWKDAVRLYMAQCTSSYFFVPFHSVLNLVRKRQVALNAGMAQVPFSKLREVVKEQFSSLMKLASGQASQHFPAAVAYDPRMRLLWKKMKHIYKKQPFAAPSVCLVLGLTVDRVDAMSVHFPLCMASLLQSLRLRHRLGHQARIQLSLFLKDLGLPVHHALALWQGEYSLPPGPGSPCLHSWQKDSLRYTYSIRHLYGLEGARRNYWGHCCSSLQQRVIGCNEEGGCPFSHWDDISLSAQLSARGVHSKDMESILSLRGAGLFSAACYQSLHISRSKKACESGGAWRKDCAPKTTHAAACESGGAWSKDCAPKTNHPPEALLCHHRANNLHTTHNSVHQLCDVEDLGANRVISLKTPTSNSCEENKLGLIIKVERRHSSTSKRTECDHETNGHSTSDAGICKRRSTVQVTSELKRLKVYTDTSSSCARHSEKCLHKCLPVIKQETSSEANSQCFDHEVCPSQHHGKDVSSLSTKSSNYPVIFRPVHYVQVSYLNLLHGLKS